MASLARKVQAEGTLTNLPKLYTIADVITRNLTVDEGLSQPTELLKIADRMKDVDLGNIAFVTVPTEPWVEDPNRLVLDEEAAAPLFDALREDRGLTESAPEPSAGPDASATPSAPAATPTPGTPAVDPATVPVLVINATTDADRGAAIQQLLVEAGLHADHALRLRADRGVAGRVQHRLRRRRGRPRRPLRHPREPGVPQRAGRGRPAARRCRSRHEREGGPPPLGSDLEGQTADQVTCQATSGL